MDNGSLADARTPLLASSPLLIFEDKLESDGETATESCSKATGSTELSSETASSRSAAAAGHHLVLPSRLAKDVDNPARKLISKRVIVEEGIGFDIE
jgi:hypothetical protein